MTVTVAKKDGDFGMEYAVRHRERFDVVVLTDPARALFAKRGLYAQHVRQDEGLTRSCPH